MLSVRTFDAKVRAVGRVSGAGAMTEVRVGERQHHLRYP